MVHVTDRALEKLKAVLTEQKAESVRIFIEGFGWGGPRLGMALDEPRDGDTVHQEHGIDWLLAPRDADFVTGINGVHVDHVKDLWGAGFYVAPVSPYGGGC